MDAGPGVIRVLHQFLEDVEGGDSDEQTLTDYFADVESGGGDVEEFKLVKDYEGHASAIYIRFTDPQCAERVCAKSHYLNTILSDRRLKYSHTESRLDIELHNQPEAEIIVYRFPDDVTETEFAVHFQHEFDARLRGCILDEEKNSYILRFLEHEAEKILEQEEQLLDEDDEDTIIKLRRLEQPIRDVLLTSESPMKPRMIKKVLKPFGEMEQCAQLTEDGLQFVVTFSTVEVAEKVASKRVLQLTEGLNVRVQIHGRDDISDIDTASPSVEMEELYPGDCKRSTTLSPPMPKPRSKPGLSVSAKKPPKLYATHVEIDKLPDDSETDMYYMLTDHLQELFGEQVSLSAFEQSYDSSHGMFRFDLSTDEIARLMNKKQFIQEGDDSTALTIRPKATGNIVEVKVVENPCKVGLGKSSLSKCFGQKSMFASKLIIHGPHLNKANLQMESFSVAAKIVAIGKHTLDNDIVVEASFSMETFPTPDPDDLDSEPITNVVEMETALSATVLAKHVKSKTQGTVTHKLDGRKYLVEYGTYEAAKEVVDQKEMDVKSRKVKVKFYVAEDEINGGTGGDFGMPTHIEVKGHAKVTPSDMYSQLIQLFEQILGRPVKAAFEHCYDESLQLFRFDFSPAEIKKLLESPLSLDEKKKKRSRLTITAAQTGATVSIKPVEGSDGQLSKTQVKAAFGPKSQFSSKVEVLSYAKDLIELKFDTCSVAALVTSIHKHKLKNGMLVEASLSKDATDNSPDESSTDEEDGEDEDKRDDGGNGGEKDDDGEDEDEKDEDEEDDDGEEEDWEEDDDLPPEKSSTTSSKKRVQLAQSAKSDLSPKTLLIENLLDEDEETICFWTKSLMGVWPLSVQISADGENAIVKMPGDCSIDNGKIWDTTNWSEFHLRGQSLRVTPVPPSPAIQVICSSTQAGAAMDEATLELYFSNERYTGVKDSSSLQSVKYRTTYDDLPVYVVTYSNSQDVGSVLHQQTQQSRKRYDVAEFYPAVGVCRPRSVHNITRDDEGGERTALSAVLHIHNIDEESIDLETLKMAMSSRKWTNGGEIDTWKEKSVAVPRSISVQVTYKETGVAERVFELYKHKGLPECYKELELELDLPWLNKEHDDHKVRLSGFTKDLDFEKIKFYLSALSDNVVTDIFVNEGCTRAVALFRNPIDYSKLVDQANLIPVKDCPGLKIQQEYKTKDVIVTGTLKKEDFEIALEGQLASKLNKDVDVYAEELPGTTDMWRITTDPEALKYMLKQKHILPRYDSISPYSEFLGLHVTSGTQQKTQALSNLVPNPLLLQFLLEEPSGHQRLADHLQCRGIALARDGMISVNPSSGRTSERMALKHWGRLRYILDEFMGKTLDTYVTDPLTDPVFDRAKPDIQRNLTGKPIVWDLNFGETQGNSPKRIAIAGEKFMVQDLKDFLTQIVTRSVSEIQLEETVAQQTISGITDIQMKYLMQIGFFSDLTTKHELTDMAMDESNCNFTISGLPRSIVAVQTTLASLLQQINQSKVYIPQSPLFLKIFQSPSSQSIIKNKVDNKKLTAVWVVENKTITVCSDSKAISQDVMNCITDAVWEGRYPMYENLDALEQQVLETDVWRKKKAELMNSYEPLEIIEHTDQPFLTIAGMSKDKDQVIEELPMFFQNKVKRTAVFPGTPERIEFLMKFDDGVFRELERAHNVVRSPNQKSGEIEITGTNDDIANFLRSLKKKHDAICRGIYEVDDPSMIEYIQENRDFLDAVGRQTSCYVVQHKEDSNSKYSVSLPSGNDCKVCFDDITSMDCDAIVNAANGGLAHVGGLALAIVQKGGEVIQQECDAHIKQNRELHEGEVYTSTSGNLKCKKVIHAVGPKWGGGNNQEEHGLYTCIDNCFEEAKRYNFQSLAIPPISTGIFGFPLNKAIKIIVDVVHDRVESKEFLPKSIAFVDNKLNSLELFQAELSARFDQAQMVQKIHERPALLNLQPKFHPAGGAYHGYKENKAPSRTGPSHTGPSRTGPSHTGPSHTGPGATVSPAVLPSATQNSGKSFTVAGRNIQIRNRLSLEVVKGDITNSQTHSLVNSVNGQLDLSVGKASKSLADKAGPQLQERCSAEAPINVGDVVETDAFQLACEKVLHCHCLQSYTPQALQVLQQIVSKCLTMAASNKHASIAFPALGTGNLRYPEGEVAKAMIEAVIDYTEKNPNSSLRDVKIVVYHQDGNTQQAFDSELQRLSGLNAGGATKKRNLMPKGKLKQDSRKSITVTGSNIQIRNRLSLEVVKGDISNSQTHSLVNSVNGQLDLSAGKASKSLADKAGPQLQDQCSAEAPINVGDVVETDAFHLACEKVLHCHCQQSYTPQALQVLQQIVSKCLTMAASNKHTSIAFPALGTGTLRYPEREVAKAMIEAVIDYTENNPNSSLKDVKIVVYHLDDNTQQGFNFELQRLSGLNAGGTKKPRNLMPKGKPQQGYIGESVDSPNSIKVNHAAINVISGDLTKHHADVLVHSTSGYMNATESSGLIAEAGTAVHQELDALSNARSADGIKVTGAGYLMASRIFHVDTFSCKQADHKWKALIIDCLRRCDEMDLKSIAFPALGTGHALKAKESAKYLINSSIQYLNDHPQSALQKIDIIVFQHGMVDDFVYAMKKPQGGLFAKLKHGASYAYNFLVQGEGHVDSLDDRHAEPNHPKHEVLTLDIYGKTEYSVDRCKSEMKTRLAKKKETVVWSKKPTYMEDREWIGKLTESQVAYLQGEAKKRNVTLTVDSSASDITIKGYSRVVYPLADLVAKQLREVEKISNQNRDESFVASKVLWMFEESASCKWIPFPTKTNKALEDVFENNPMSTYTCVNEDHEEVLLDLKTMSGTDSQGDFLIRRSDLTKPQDFRDVPTYWEEPFKRNIPLRNGTSEYQKVERPFMASLGKGGSTILQITRVQNPFLFKQYEMFRGEVAARLGSDEDQVETRPLWHGTDKDTASLIASGKFDRNYTGKHGAVYGGGSYFAKDSAYSARDRYSKADDQGHKYIIQTRVITGDWCLGKEGMLAAPFKDVAKTEQYDSVVDDVNDPTIFVVFHDASAYPEYIIKFQ